MNRHQGQLDWHDHRQWLGPALRSVDELSQQKLSFVFADSVNGHWLLFWVSGDVTVKNMSDT